MAQSCKGIAVPVLVLGVTLPPAPDSLHWKPFGAGSAEVLKAQLAERLLVRIAGLEVMRATGKLQDVVGEEDE